MPASTPRPGRRRLYLRQRRLRVPVVFYAHPFELGIGAAFIVIGLKGLISDVGSPSVDALPHPLAIGYRITQLIAGLGILAGLTLRERSKGRAIERAACYVLGSSLIAFAVAVVARNGSTGWDVGLVYTFIGLACVARGKAIAKTERVILEQLRAANAVAVPDLLKIIDGRPPRDPNDEERRHE